MSSTPPSLAEQTVAIATSNPYLVSKLDELMAHRDRLETAMMEMKASWKDGTFVLDPVSVHTTILRHKMFIAADSAKDKVQGWFRVAHDSDACISSCLFASVDPANESHGWLADALEMFTRDPKTLNTLDRYDSNIQFKYRGNDDLSSHLSPVQIDLAKCSVQLCDLYFHIRGDEGPTVPFRSDRFGDPAAIEYTVMRFKLVVDLLSRVIRALGGDDVGDGEHSAFIAECEQASAAIETLVESVHKRYPVHQAPRRESNTNTLTEGLRRDMTQLVAYVRRYKPQRSTAGREARNAIVNAARSVSL